MDTALISALGHLTPDRQLRASTSSPSAADGFADSADAVLATFIASCFSQSPSITDHVAREKLWATFDGTSHSSVVTRVPTNWAFLPLYRKENEGIC